MTIGWECPRCHACYAPKAWVENPTEENRQKARVASSANAAAYAARRSLRLKILKYGMKLCQVQSTQPGSGEEGK